MEERKKNASLKARLAELTETRIQVKREERKRKMAKLDRKKVNVMRSAKY